MEIVTSNTVIPVTLHCWSNRKETWFCLLTVFLSILGKNLLIQHPQPQGKVSLYRYGEMPVALHMWLRQHGCCVCAACARLQEIASFMLCPKAHLPTQHSFSLSLSHSYFMSYTQATMSESEHLNSKAFQMECLHGSLGRWVIYLVQTCLCSNVCWNLSFKEYGL